ncbi:MAG TPA: thioesterase family protein [Acidimicrobiales bacterium]
MTIRFRSDTAVTRLSDSRWRAELAERWSSLVGIHGGYAVAIATRAIDEAVGDPAKPVRTLSAQFLRPLRPGPVEIGVTIERRGQTLVFASARLHQEHRTALLVRTTSAGTPGYESLAYDDHRRRPRPARPPVGLGRFAAPGLVRHFEQVDVRMDPDVTPFSGGGEARVAAWLRPLDDEPVDTAWLVAACDVLPPAAFSRTTGPVRAATLDYTVHLPVADPAARVPVGAHVYLDCRSPLAADGLVVEDGELWGPDGTVLAVSRQTRAADARVPLSSAGPAAPATPAAS